MTAKQRLVVVVSHPIQYYAPLYRALAHEPALDLHVIFASRIGLRRTFDPKMGVAVAWATDLTGGYSHEFLPEADTITEVGFRRVDNPSVAAALRRARPDAVIVHGYAMLTMLRALAWCRLHGVRTIMASDSSTHAGPAGLRRWVKTLAMPLLLRQYGAALTMSDRSERHLASLGYPRARMVRMPMMIDEGFWRARAERAAIRARQRARLGLGDDEMALLAVGKLYPGKRVLDVIEALSRRRVNGAVPALVVAGDGGQRAELEAFAAARGVRALFLGFVNIDALPEVYAGADALVHAAELEQFGMVVLEAATLGLPLILSDRVGAIGESSIARPEVNALVYPCGDVEALARAIGRLADDAELRRRMGEASLTISADHAGPASVAAVLRAIGR